MTIHDDIARDLLPLYAANECSAESRKVVEEYLCVHPEAAAAMADAARTLLRGPIPTSPGGDLERRALARTQRLLRQRTYFLSLAIFFSLMPFSFTFSNGSVSWLITGAPTHAGMYAVVGAGLWIAYLFTRRNLRERW